MKVGIIGGGHIAEIHGSLVLKQPDAKIVGITDKDLIRAKTLASRLNADHVYHDAKVMLDEQKPDVVHILVPPQYHAELSLMAMNHGCHVLVEKPMALVADDAKKMIETAKQNQVHLCANHNLIFEDVVQRTRQLISQGDIGEIVSAEACYLFNPRRYPAILEEGAEYSHWTYRMNGGPLQDMMPHPASLVLEYLPEIREVQSIGHNRGILPKGWQDEIRVLVKSDSVIGYISISLSERPDTITLTLKGTRGTIQANLFNDILTLQMKSDLPRAVARGLSGFQLTRQNFAGALGNIYKFATGRLDKTNGLWEVVSRFYESIRNGEEVPIPADIGLRVVDFMERIWPTPMRFVQKAKSLKHSPISKTQHPTALVTGASGFIGTHLIKKLLDEDITIRALVRTNSVHAGRLKDLDIEVVEGDLADANVLYEVTKGIKKVYHAGATLNNNWEEHKRTNIQGTKYLIDAALTHKVERFVYLSTLAVYGLDDVKKNPIIKEDSSYHKNSKRMGPYYYSKTEAEKLVLDAYQRYGLRVTVVRPGLVIGPRGPIFFQQLGYQYRDRLFLLIGNGNNILPLTYVENTVDGIYKAAIEDKAIGQIYNLTDDSEITSREYIEHFIKNTHTEAQIISIPYIIPYIATAIYEIGVFMRLLPKGVTSRSQLKWKQAPVRFDNTKAKTDLGWVPCVTIEKGLTRTFEWYVSQHRD